MSKNVFFDLEAKTPAQVKASSSPGTPQPPATPAKSLRTPAVTPAAASTPTAPAAATLATPSQPLLEVFQRYAAAYNDIAPLPKQEDVVEEPAFAPTVHIPDGYVALSTLINGASDSIPVKVFQDTDWPIEIRSYIPTSLPNEGKWHWDIDLVNQFAEAMFFNDRTLAHGPTGSGKSAIVEAWAYLCRIPLIRVNCHRDMQSSDFLGKDIIKTTKQGPVLEYDWSMTTLGAKFGGLLLIDEAFRSPHLMSIQSLLERNGTLTLPDAASLKPEERKIVPPQGKFWIALTDNTCGTGDESGSYVSEVQDLSTLDRITATIYVGYTPPEKELEFLAEDFPEVPQSKIRGLVEWTHKMREAFLSRAVQQPISRRALNSILRKYQHHGDLAKAVRMSYLAKLSKPDQHEAKEAWKQVFGTEMEAA